jgi:LuxR family glucitol operon transcriptional activator
MNKSSFDEKFKQLTERKKEVLKTLLSGKSDEAAVAADCLCIAESTYRKHIQKIGENFGFKNKEGERSNKRPALVELFLKHKPEWVTPEAIEKYIESNSPEPVVVKGVKFDELQDLQTAGWHELDRSDGIAPDGAPKEVSAPLQQILHNLPAGTYSSFFGRQVELERLLQLLQPTSGVHRISLCGLGGVGKTSLMLEVANRCLQPHRYSDSQTIPTFAAIIFASAKTEQLLPNGILPKHRRDRTLQDIFRAIATTLQCPEILIKAIDQQSEQIYYQLGQQSVLLLLDNLETIEDVKNVYAFLCDLPSTVKVMITSRAQELLEVVIPLAPLSKDESLALIQHQIQEKRVTTCPESAQQIYQLSAGLPTAIVYTIGQLASGYPLTYLRDRSRLTMQELSRYCFESSIAPLREHPAHRLLLALALFLGSAQGTAIAFIAEISDPDQLIESVVKLKQLSLISEATERYKMLPLTRSYALSELEADVTLAQQMRDRWIAWYMQFVQQHGNPDQQEWHDYLPLEQEWETLRDCMDYCMVQGRYHDFKHLWHFLNSYTHNCGHWNERLLWMDWLIQAAEHRQDWATLAAALFEKVRTFVFINQPDYLETAIALCQRALALADAQTPASQFDLLIHLTTFHIQQQQFDQAQIWLAEAGKLLPLIENLQTPADSRQIKLLYYRAQICLETGEYDTADRLYNQALVQAESINWQRATTYIKDWLAVVAIKQGKFVEAEALLMTGLAIAEQQNDQRCTAYCQRSLATLEKARGNLDQMRHWAECAKLKFNQLQMFYDAQKIDQLLKQN